MLGKLSGAKRKLGHLVEKINLVGGLNQKWAVFAKFSF